ncbi:type I CRISPR-associated protein Cas7 [Clostridium sp.]|uniref:type I CRISPR-associated protein Cas7 n=1 Tax=Clostridium sp. TaxID=1506 RepID=UPI0026394318|nr:type I CRISPR-associated protein Cas7 [Clostridium sp.]
MDKRVYGVIGISSKMANWNADFTGYPKTTSNGDVFGSDKALKYPMKKMWDENGEKVLYIKSMTLLSKEDKKSKTKDVSLVPRTLKERYELLFGIEDLKTIKDQTEVYKNLFNAIDVKNFGATFAEEGNNISITGAVQIGQGLNKYDGILADEQQILSPFRDSKDLEKKQKAKKDDEDIEEAKNSTLGTKIVTTEAHYFYPFSINPLAYKDYKDLGFTDGYTEEDYSKFKEAALASATSYATNSKLGCENEFALFVETEKDLYIPNLSQYVTFEKGKDKDKDMISVNCGKLLNSLSEKIKNIEIYHNPYTTTIESDIEGAKILDIFTRQEV